MIFASLIASFLARHGGVRRAAAEDETPPDDDPRGDPAADRHGC
jgi:hypothetical protein